MTKRPSPGGRAEEQLVSWLNQGAGHSLPLPAARGSTLTRRWSKSDAHTSRAPRGARGTRCVRALPRLPHLTPSLQKHLLTEGSHPRPTETTRQKLGQAGEQESHPSLSQAPRQGLAVILDHVGRGPRASGLSTSPGSGPCSLLLSDTTGTLPGPRTLPPAGPHGVTP